jgi:hypothetical protein
MSRSAYGFAVHDKPGKIVCYLNLTEQYRATLPDELQFILIAQNRQWKERLGPVVDIMHVKTEGGITYRVQGIHDSVITLDIWKSMEPKWELLVMAR